MAFQKLYLLDRAAPYTPATIRGAWSDTAGAVAKALDPRKEGGGASTTVARAETNAGADYKVLLYRGISGPLAAQTINCNLDVVIGVKESNAAADDYWYLHVYVTQGDSDTPRGTLVADYGEASGSGTEWTTTATGRALNAAQAINLAVSAGDRIVAEIGYIAKNASATSYTGTLNYGTVDAFGVVLDDLAALGTDVTTKAGFLSFSASIAEQDLTASLARLAIRAASLDSADARLARLAIRTLSPAWTSTALLAAFVVRTLSEKLASTPPAPVLVATALDHQRISLTWADVALETSYELEWSLDGSPLNYVPLITLAADVTSYLHTGLEQLTHYWYRLRAVNGAGASAWSYDDATTLLAEEFEPDPGIDRSGETIGYVWEEIRAADDALECYTDIGRAINDDADYYGGRKAPRVKSFGPIERALSDYRGLYEGATFSAVHTDGDWYFRIRHATRLYAGASVVWRTISEAARQLRLLARTLIRGIVSEVRPQANRLFEIVCTDVLSRHFGVADDERQIPRRTLSRTQFTDLPTDQIGLAEPILYGALSDEGSDTAPPVLTYDAAEGGYTDGGDLSCGFGPLACDADPPADLTATAVAGGALSLDVPNGEYGVMAWSVDADGDESDPVPFFISRATGGTRGAFDATPHDTVTAGNQQIDVTWTVGADAVATRVALGVYYYGWRPLQILEVAAPGASCSFDAGAAWPDVVPSTSNITAGATPATWSTIRYYRVSAVMADGETGLSSECVAVVREYRRPARVRWTAVPGAISYNVYGRSPGFAVDRSWSVDGSPLLTYLDDDWLDTEAVIISGAPAARGVVPVLYVGTEQIVGMPWSRFLVASHAVTSIDGFFQGDVRVDPGCFGVTWLAPGQAGWPFGDPYRDLGGRRYTLLYVRGPDGDDAVTGARPITLNVSGIEDVGDGTGYLITDITLQHRHFVQNFGFGDWQTGAWLTSPTFPADPAPEDTDVVSQIDDDGFDTAVEVTDARAVGGATGGGLIGNKGVFSTLREVLATFCLSGGVDCGINRKTQYAVWAFDTRAAALVGTRVLSEVREIDATSFTIQDVDAEHWNARPYRYAYDWARETWGATGEVEDAASIARYGMTKRGPDLALWFVRTATWATDLVEREVARTADPPRRVKFQTPAVGYNVELGDLVRVTHSDGVGNGGWTLQPCRVIRHVALPDILGVELVLDDVADRMES